MLKRKELKQLAEKLAKLELVLQKESDPETVKQTKNKIIELTGHVDDYEDLFILDEYIQKILDKQKS